MDIFIGGLPTSTSNSQLTLQLANILHAPPFRRPTDKVFNFHVHLFKQRKNSRSRSAFLTLPVVEIGEEFLRLYGTSPPYRTFFINNSRVRFERSSKPIRTDVLENIQKTPFVDPREAHALEQRDVELRALEVRVNVLQFGWECADHVYSVEWEKQCEGSLDFNLTRREFRIKLGVDGLFGETKIVTIRANQIYWVSASNNPRPNIFFSLTYPPAFESESSVTTIISQIAPTNVPTRQRWTVLDDDHAHIAPYTSIAIRLECESPKDLLNFREFAKAANNQVSDDWFFLERRGLFSQTYHHRYNTWINTLPWTVAFQVEALLRSWLVSLADVLTLRSSIDSTLATHGVEYLTSLLRDFFSHAKSFFWYGEVTEDNRPNAQSMSSSSSSPIQELFSRIARGFVFKQVEVVDDPSAPFQCHHVAVTPTTMILEGPYPERSNRIMRTYFKNQDSFLRVSFQDENRLQYRFDREVDGRSFINRRVKHILLEGITVAGAHFDFLAYSQSALKEHAVWFVKPFRHTDGSRVDAKSIIASLGNFRDLAYDPMLIRCPARYAARISQAFTATDASIEVEVGQIATIHDIKDDSGKYAFTDGVGSISPRVAKDIWKALQARRRRGRKDRTYPRAYQIRFQGSKGMVSVDYTLSGRQLLLRPSMIKFDAQLPQPTIEIARAFDRPGAYFLNRPLIMLLEGLGVPYEVFQDLQDEAELDAKRSIESLEWSARLLEGHGLGTSFRLTSAMLGLHKLGLGPPRDDPFWRQMMDFAINHVLRELKHHARIPVRGTDSWTLVGVADVHGYLRQGEVFACIDSPNHHGLIYLEGPVLVSRSPTIHPGDVQVVRAIGRPPPGSPFERESLRNTIVFSILGGRPLPSYLGGGDLDGDVYNVTTREDLIPPQSFHPASYDPAPKKILDRESTMADVADFVAEFISSDTLGIIAITWLIIADQSTQGILDPDCLKLAALHSDAVDYPKSGQPVPLNQIPRLKYPRKPDWNAPETLRKVSEYYYESTRAIGKLYRSIDLPALDEAQYVARQQRKTLKQHDGAQLQLADVIEAFYDDETHEDDEIMETIQEYISEYIRIDGHEEGLVKDMWELYRSYASQLLAICADHTLSRERSQSILTEEEAVVGTIVAKCSQPRKRKDLMSQMREKTAALVVSVKDDIAGDDEVPSEESLQRAWVAYRVANIEHNTFGARSFSWVALGCIFDAIKEIEAEERTASRRM